MLAVTVDSLLMRSSAARPSWRKNTLREGVGLTATEAMWKARPVLGTPAAGIRSQILDGVQDRLVRNPEIPSGFSATPDEMLGDEEGSETYGRNGRSRVAENFLVFEEVRRWLEVLPPDAVSGDRSEAA